MFIEARERLINLYLLQNMIVTQILDNKYAVRFVFINGETYDEEYDTENEAEDAYDGYKSELLAV